MLYAGSGSAKSRIKVDFNLFPKIAIYRSFQKVYVNYDIPEHILEEICYLGEINFNESFKTATLDMIREVAGKDFTEFYYQNMENVEIAGVLDYYGSWFFRKNIFKRDYLNSGVLLMNMVQLIIYLKHY